MKPGLERNLGRRDTKGKLRGLEAETLGSPALLSQPRPGHGVIQTRTYVASSLEGNLAISIKTGNAYATDLIGTVSRSIHTWTERCLRRLITASLLEAENERKSLSGCIYSCVYTHMIYSPSEEWQCDAGNSGYIWAEELSDLEPEMGFSLAFLSFVPLQHYLPDKLK